MFIRETDIDNLWKSLKKDKFINEYFKYKSITDEEMEEMIKGIEFIRDDISFGDIVRINDGKFNKLNGIVLRDKKEEGYLVGFKFCFGTSFITKQASELEIVGNIFNYIKVKK